MQARIAAKIPSKGAYLRGLGHYNDYMKQLTVTCAGLPVDNANFPSSPVLDYVLHGGFFDVTKST